MIKQIKKLLHTLRWGFVPTRYVTLVLGLKLRYLFRKTQYLSTVSSSIEKKGYCICPKVDTKILNDIVSTYKPRTFGLDQINKKIPFVNLFNAQDIDSANPVFSLAFSEHVLKAAYDYYHGKCILDSLQVLHSFKTEAVLKESQLWHLDYGDSKSFHYICYLNDVNNPSDGPFVFLDKTSSKKIGKSLFVRRVPDEEVNNKVKKDEIISVYGPAGTSFFVDPSVCYHYGSRCQNTRLAIFITFSSRFPFAQPSSFILNNKEKMFSEFIKQSSSISSDFIKDVLQLQ